MGSIKFSLVRHAQSEANASLENKINGHNLGTKLTKRGEAQAEALGAYFKREGVAFTAAYSSTAIRTQKTAEICFRAMGCELPLSTDEQLLELDQGSWAGLYRDDIYNRADVRQALDTDNWNYIPGDDVPGESQKMVAVRMKSWIERKVDECNDDGQNHHLVVFTHGLAIKFLLAELLDSERSTAFRNPIDNTSITELCYRDKQLVLPLTKKNNSEHLHV